MRKIPFVLVVGFLALVVGSRSMLQAAQPNRLYVKNQTMKVGDTGVEIPIRCDTDQVRHGFSIALKYDPAKLKVTSITTAGSTSATADWSHGQNVTADGKVSWGVVMSLPENMQDPFEQNKVIPIGTNEVILKLIVNVLATVATTDTIQFRDDLGTPAGGWVNILSYKGEASIHPQLTPETGEGTITIEALPTGNQFLRGDCNGDGGNDISDAVASLNYQFLAGAAPPCMEACRTNDDDSLDISDPVYLLALLFQGGPPPRTPYPACDTAEPADCAADTCK